jgi:hypothetical protein
MTEEELRQERDWEWCMRQPEILQKYAGQVVVVHRERLVGHGVDHWEALHDAMMNIEGKATEPTPPQRELTFIAIPELPPTPQTYPWH